MNYLELCQEAARQCGIPASISTTQNQSGEALNVVNWVRTAYLDIQVRRTDWSWLWRISDALELWPGVNVIDPVSDWGVFPIDWIRLSIGDTDLIEWEWPDFREKFKTIGPGAPQNFCVRPDRKMVFDATATSTIILSGEWRTTAEKLVVDTDTPSMPEQYHMAVVWRAVRYYAASEEAGALYQTADREFRSMMDQMARTETPQVSTAGPLA